MNFKYKTKPYAHQEEALKRSYDKRNYAYFMEMGCGKSKVLLDNITWLAENKKIDTVIIVAPKGVYMNWKNSEIPIHLHEDIKSEIYVWRAMANKKQKNELMDAIKKRDKLRKGKKHKKDVSISVGGGTNRLERYRIPEKIIEIFFTF